MFFYCRISGAESDSVEIILDSPEPSASASVSADNGIKKKRKKKHKHKKHNADGGKSGHTKKHKKHKRKRHSSSSILSETESSKLPKISDDHNHDRDHDHDHEHEQSPHHSDDSARYTPEPVHKSSNVCSKNTNNVVNGKSCSGKREPIMPSTETDAVVEYITAGVCQLPKEASLEIVSSDSEDNEPIVEDCDSDDIDVAVIEEDMNLEELMKQKELLQARLGEYLSDVCTDGGNDTETIHIIGKTIEIKNKKHAVVNNDEEVILLDDSSNDSNTHKVIDGNRDRRIYIGKKDNYYNREELRRKRSRSPFDRNKVFLQRRRSRERRSLERKFREVERKRSRERMRSRERIRDRSREKNRFKERSRSRGRKLERGRSRENNRYLHYERERSRERYDRRDHRYRDRRHRDERDKRRDKNDLKDDKYKDSLSEGLGKVSSDSEIDENIEIKEEEDEEQIIEKRRKQREELMKV